MKNKLILVPQIFGYGVIKPSFYCNIDKTPQIMGVYEDLRKDFGDELHKIENEEERDRRVMKLKFPSYPQICLSSELILFNHGSFDVLGLGYIEDKYMETNIKSFNRTVSKDIDKRTETGIRREMKHYVDKASISKKRLYSTDELNSLLEWSQQIL